MAISNSGSFVQAFFLYILLSLAGGIGNACLDTLVMRGTPVRLQPVIFGMLSAVSGTLLGLSMLTAGWMLDYVEPRTLGFAGEPDSRVLRCCWAVMLHCAGRWAKGPLN